MDGTRQSFEFFLKKNLCRAPYGRHSAKFDFFFKKNSLPSVMVTALGRAGKSVFWAPIFPALPSAVTILPSATLGKVTQNGNFFLHSIMINTFIQTYITYISHPSHIYLIHPHIHPPISHPSQYISHI